MAQYLISDNVLTDIADAIRNKLGTTETYKPINMKSAINSISTGGGQTSSINIQIAAGGNRVSTTSYSAVSGQTLTVQKTGTYDVYWSGFRSSTSGTNGSQLYIDGTAYGSANTTFTNHGQYIHLTNVSLTKDSVIAVRARARTTSSYMYVSNLTIVEQS